MSVKEDGDIRGYIQEPSILYVVPDNKKWHSEFVFDNEIKEDGDLYLCSVFTCGYPDFLEFSKKIGRKRIIVGGYHPSLCPKDFLGYASKIVVGFGNNIDEIIESKKESIIRGRFKFNHMDRSVFPLDRLSLPFADIFPGQLSLSINTFMGCLFSCDLSMFCSASVMYKNKKVFYPIKYLKRELEIIGQYSWDNLFIRDEGLFFHPDFFKIVKLVGSTGKKIISTGAPPPIEKLKNIIKFLKENNWFYLNLGFNVVESVREDKNLILMMEQLYKYKINTHLTIVIKADKDKSEAGLYFKKILKTLFKLMPTSIEIFFLTPFPRTKTFRKYRNKNLLKNYKIFDLSYPMLSNSNLIGYYKRKAITLQLEYYQSKEYAKMRNFNCGDNLNLQILELKEDSGLVREKDLLPYSCR